MRDRGLVAPGWRADLVVVDSLENCKAEIVLSAGRRVTPDLFTTRKPVEPVGLDSVRARQVTAADFSVPARDGVSSVLGVIPGKIITEHRRLRLPNKGNETSVDLINDVLKVTVIERHGKNGNVATAFVQGFGLKKGAIASTVGHDSHNICVVGADDDDMALAANRLSEIHGGFVVVEGGKITGEIALPVAGLMSLDPYETVRDTLHHLRQAAYALGSTLQEPFLQLAFLPLPVIPHLKISDKGLVDVDKFELMT